MAKLLVFGIIVFVVTVIFILTITAPNNIVEQRAAKAGPIALAKGTCKFELIDLPGGLSSSCNAWSPCGMRRNAVAIGGALGPAEIDASGMHQVRLEDFGLQLPRGGVAMQALQLA